MIDKEVRGLDEALDGITEGATLLVGGFGEVGVPHVLLAGIAERGIGNLTIVANNCGTGEEGLGLLFRERLVRKIYASFPAQPGAFHFRAAWEAGTVEVELVPQGSLAARLDAGGAGLGAIFLPAAMGTRFVEGRRIEEFDGRPYTLEAPITGDFALVKAHKGDRHGNLRYRRSARNFNPLMARAAKTTIAQVDELVDLGALDPDDIHTPGIFVTRVLPVARGG